MRFIILCLSLCVTACTVPGPSEPVAQIASAQNLWRAQNVRRYRIAVQKTNARLRTQTNTLTVEDGRVTHQTATCVPAPREGRTCQVEPFDANEFTVDGLFQTALALAPASAQYNLRVDFDAQYHFPKFISRDEKARADDETTWRVVEFQPLP
ncbi:MAG: hypothetical protein DCC52_12970 [Chloroflexi bacterium]|nr:MAG: hypothetical protein DCC52_12970 [Chloroflexota bacterium]